MPMDPARARVEDEGSAPGHEPSDGGWRPRKDGSEGIQQSYRTASAGKDESRGGVANFCEGETAGKGAVRSEKDDITNSKTEYIAFSFEIFSSVKRGCGLFAAENPQKEPKRQ